MKYWPCPKCGGSRCQRERRPNGNTLCWDCGLRLPSSAWDQLKNKLAADNEGKLISSESGPLTPGEIDITSQRKEELWERLERVIPSDGSGLNSPGIIKQVKLIIMNYISELEMRGEIPHGLTVAGIIENPKREGHLIVQFGLTSDCKQADREKLLGFITGRLAFI